MSLQAGNTEISDAYPDREVTFRFTDIKGSTTTVRSLSRQDYKEPVLDPHLKSGVSW